MSVRAAQRFFSFQSDNPTREGPHRPLYSSSLSLHSSSEIALVHGRPCPIEGRLVRPRLELLGQQLRTGSEDGAAAHCSVPPCTSKAIPAARGGGLTPPVAERCCWGGGGSRPPAAERTDPALQPLRPRRPPSTLLGSCLSVRSRRLCSPRLRARLAVGGPAGETTDFGADHKFSPLEHMWTCTLVFTATAAVCTEMPAPPTATGRALLLGGGGPDPPSSRALLLGGGSAMALDVQGGTEPVCGRSNGGHGVCGQCAAAPSLTTKLSALWSLSVSHTLERRTRHHKINRVLRANNRRSCTPAARHAC